MILYLGKVVPYGPDFINFIFYKKNIEVKKNSEDLTNSSMKNSGKNDNFCIYFETSQYKRAIKLMSCSLRNNHKKHEK